MRRKATLSRSACSLLDTYAVPTIGVLVGHVGDSWESFVVSAIPTPSEDRTTKIEGWWVDEHAKEVETMLLGGSSLLGFFCKCTGESDGLSLVGVLHVAAKRFLRKKARCLFLQYTSAEKHVFKDWSMEAKVFIT